MPKEVIKTPARSKLPKSNLIMRWGQHDSEIGIEFEEWFSFHKDADNPDKDGAVREYNSLWFHFETREQFNDLIRTLRRMRDSQFGRDE